MRVRLLMSSLPWMQEVPPTEPVEGATKASGTQWRSPLEVAVQPPLSRSS
jgi:hypothetical protein